MLKKDYQRRVEKIKREQKLIRYTVEGLLTEAIAANRKLRASSFKHVFQAVHEDGSSYYVQNCIVKCETVHDRRYIVVYHEHGTPMVFVRDDLFTFQIFPLMASRPI